MKTVGNYLDKVIDAVQMTDKKSPAIVLVLVVLMLGAGSIYVLLNTPA